MNDRPTLATLKLHQDALDMGLFYGKDHPQQDQLVAWLFEKGEMFAQIATFLSTVGSEIQKGEHGHSAVLVCYGKDPR